MAPPHTICSNAQHATIGATLAMHRLSPPDAHHVKAKVLAFVVRFRAFNAQGPVGPLAVVVPDGKADLVARVLGILASADRPMRVFRTVALARRWIEALPK